VLPIGTASARAKVWHVLDFIPLEGTLLADTTLMTIDPSIQSAVERKGGQGNIEVCGFDRTEGISTSRQMRWDAGDRWGSVVVMQLKTIDDGAAAFSRLKKAYVGCTPAKFGSDDASRVTVKGNYSKKKKYVHLVWTWYKDSTQSDALRAEDLNIKRAGAALIITRSIAHDPTALRASIGTSMTAKQFVKYKAAAFA
jgi:hypothetical protein